MIDYNENGYLKLVQKYLYERAIQYIDLIEVYNSTNYFSFYFNEKNNGFIYVFGCEEFKECNDYIIKRKIFNNICISKKK